MTKIMYVTKVTKKLMNSEIINIKFFVVYKLFYHRISIFPDILELNNRIEFYKFYLHE